MHGVRSEISNTVSRSITLHYIRIRKHFRDLVCNCMPYVCAEGRRIRDDGWPRLPVGACPAYLWGHVPLTCGGMSQELNPMASLQ